MTKVDNLARDGHLGLHSTIASRHNAQAQVGYRIRFATEDAKDS